MLKPLLVVVVAVTVALGRLTTARSVTSPRAPAGEFGSLYTADSRFRLLRVDVATLAPLWTSKPLISAEYATVVPVAPQPNGDVVALVVELRVNNSNTIRTIINNNNVNNLVQQPRALPRHHHRAMPQSEQLGFQIVRLSGATGDELWRVSTTDLTGPVPTADAMFWVGPEDSSSSSSCSSSTFLHSVDIATGRIRHSYPLKVDEAGPYGLYAVSVTPEGDPDVFFVADISKYSEQGFGPLRAFVLEGDGSTRELPYSPLNFTLLAPDNSFFLDRVWERSTGKATQLRKLDRQGAELGAFDILQDPADNPNVLFSPDSQILYQDAWPAREDDTYRLTAHALGSGAELGKVLWQADDTTTPFVPSSDAVFHLNVSISSGTFTVLGLAAKTGRQLWVSPAQPLPAYVPAYGQMAIVLGPRSSAGKQSVAVFGTNWIEGDQTVATVVDAATGDLIASGTLPTHEGTVPQMHCPTKRSVGRAASTLLNLCAFSP